MTRDHLIAVVWKDKRDVHMLTNLHSPQVGNDLLEECGSVMKPIVVEQHDH